MPSGRVHQTDPFLPGTLAGTHRHKQKKGCRFFLERKDFDAEVELYRDATLSQILPQILHGDDNARGSACTRGGYILPPYLVLERGITLEAWSRTHARNFFEVSAMIDSVARMLATLHASGRVHRDLKPGAKPAPCETSHRVERFTLLQDTFHCHTLDKDMWLS